MKARYTKAYAESLVSSYIEDIRRQKEEIQRNFDEMDFENCQVKEDFRTIVKSLMDNCDRLIYEIESRSNFE